MAIQCPNCAGEVPVEQVNIGVDTALCPHCRQMFRPSEMLGPRSGDTEDWSSFGTSVAPEKPTDRDVVMEYFEDGGVGMYLPPGDSGKRSRFYFTFSILWNAIVFAVGGGFGWGMVQGDVPWLMVLFFIPFMAVGVLLLFWGCWLAWGSTSVGLDRQGMWLEQKLFGRRRLRTYSLEHVEGFRRNKAYEQNDEPVYACCVKINGRKHNFAHKLSDEHQQWLVNEFNQALRRVKSSPP